MVLQGLFLLVVGMGTVAGFLLMLVVVLTFSARIIPRFNHLLPDEQPKRKPAKAETARSAAGDEEAVAIAVAAAVARSRA